MTIFLHELKRNRLSIIIWSLALSFMLGVCVLIYPEMASQMEEMSDMFADMGNFTAAFGMDQLNFGEFMGYFGIECGNTLGLGGAFFAAITGIAILSKEEKYGTADFLLSHPISRKRIITEKLGSVIAQIIILNVTVMAVTFATVLMIGEQPDVKTMFLLFFANFMLQLEIAAITFGISAFVKRGGLGIGLGLTFFFYFLNIMSNLTEEIKFLKYLTPFSYAEGSYIIPNASIEWKYLLVGIVFIGISLVMAYTKYTKKDIA